MSTSPMHIAPPPHTHMRGPASPSPCSEGGAPPSQEDAATPIGFYDDGTPGEVHRLMIQPGEVWLADAVGTAGCRAS